MMMMMIKEMVFKKADGAESNMIKLMGMKLHVSH